MGTKLHASQTGHVLVLTISDPEIRNALNSDAFYSDLEQTVRSANADLSIRAVIITGDGKEFSSGGNVRDMRDRKGMFDGTPEQIAEQYRTGIQRIPRAF